MLETSEEEAWVLRMGEIEEAAGGFQGAGCMRPKAKEVHGCSHEKDEPHTCPFAEEIHGDNETLCTCCDECTYQCAMDI